MYTLMDPRDLEAGMIFEGHIISNTEVVDIDEGPHATLVVRGLKGGRPVNIPLDGTPIIRFRGPDSSVRHARVGDIIHRNVPADEMVIFHRVQRKKERAR